YRLIHRANAVIQMAPEAEFTNEGLRGRFIGEAKFLRAWAYYQLYTLWGDVPIMDEFATTLDGSKPRSPKSEGKAQIVKDLTDAANALPESYSVGDIGRASTIAAQALLAKNHMLGAQYREVKPLLEAVTAACEAASSGNPLRDEYFDNCTEEAKYKKESIREDS